MRDGEEIHYLVERQQIIYKSKEDFMDFLAIGESAAKDVKLGIISNQDKSKSDNSKNNSMHQHERSIESEVRHSQNPAHIAGVSNSPRLPKDEGVDEDRSSHRQEGSNPPLRAQSDFPADSVLEEVKTGADKRYQGHFDEKEEGEVGIELQQRHDEVLLVSSTWPGSPSQRAGILAGDVLVMVDGFSMHHVDAQTARDFMKGPAGSAIAVEAQQQVKGELVKQEPRSIEGSRRDHLTESAVAPDERHGVVVLSSERGRTTTSVSHVCCAGGWGIEFRTVGTLTIDIKTTQKINNRDRVKSRPRTTASSPPASVLRSSANNSAKKKEANRGHLQLPQCRTVSFHVLHEVGQTCATRVTSPPVIT
eukprot:108578-Hanusia_phi.AAC.3